MAEFLISKNNVKKKKKRTCQMVREACKIVRKYYSLGRWKMLVKDEIRKRINRRTVEAFKFRF